MANQLKYHVEDFDGGDINKPEVEEVEKFFVEQDIKNAEAFGYATGYSKGLNEGYMEGEIQAIREKDLQLQTVLHSANEKLAIILMDNKIYIETLEQNSVDLSITILSAIMPDIMKNFLKIQMTEFIKNIVKKTLKTQKITISTSPEMYDVLKNKLPNYFGDSADGIELLKDDAIQITECQIKWDGGHAFSNILQNFELIKTEMQTIYNVDKNLWPQLNPNGE